MFRFWESIIEPITNFLQPKTIVEIGSSSGRNTRFLIEFCFRNEAVLHSIDPNPGFDVEELSKEYGRQFVFHRELSLNALPIIKSIDLVLIDGDHNWYTVFNEFKLLDKAAKEENRSFPVILVHDVGWPYGRRDLYYLPDSIPDEYRKPYKNNGITPGRSELVGAGGLNGDLCNAVLESGKKNGVLTAIEDFLDDEELDLLELVTVPGFHGLGIVFQKDFLEKAENKQFFDRLVVSEPIKRHIEAIELARIGLEIDRIREAKATREREKTQKESRQNIELQLKEKNEENAKIKQDLTVLSEKHKKQSGTIQNKDAEIASLSGDIQHLKDELEDKASVIQDLQSQLSEEKKALVDAKNQTARHAEIVKQKENELKTLAQTLAAKDKVLREKADQANRLLPLAHRARELEQLLPWIEVLEKDARKLLSSKRWKTGNTIGEIQRRLMRKQRTGMPAERIERILDQYDEWKRSYRKSGEAARPLVLERDKDNVGQRTDLGASQLNKLVSSKIDEPISKLWSEIRLTQRLLETRTRASIPPNEMKKAVVCSAGDVPYALDPRFTSRASNGTDPKENEERVQEAYDFIRGRSIFFILEHLRPSGGPNVVLCIAERLAGRGFEVGIICPRLPEWQPRKVDVVDFSSPRLRHADAIVATAWPTIHRLNDFETSVGSGFQKVLFCQSDEPSWWPFEKRNVLGYPGDNWHEQALKAFLSKSYKHIIIANWMEKLADKYKFDIVGKVHVATPRSMHLSARPKGGPNWVVGFINRGRNVWFKGRTDCLDVLRILRKRYPWLIIRSIGFDPLDDELAQLDIIYQQNPSDSEINEFYNNSDVYISSSYIEGCPLPQQEAMWCGCPVVTTPPGVRGEYDLLGNENTCVVVEQGNILGMADAVGRLLEDENLWNKYRLMGLRGIMHRSTDTMIDDFAVSIAKALRQ